MKALKKLAVFCVGAALTVGSAFGFAACDNGTDPQGYDDPNIREVYSLYVVSAEESGNEPMTYEEWLASIKGDKGDPGDPGQPGKDGSSFLHGEGEPKATDGKAGDLYLDVLTGDLYEKDANGWSADPVGNLKGPQGEQGPKGDKGDSATGSGTEPADDAVKTWDNVTIQANGTYSLDLTEVNDGYYWLLIDTETVAQAGILTETYKVSKSESFDEIPYDMYSSVSNTFKGFVYVMQGVDSITLNNTSSSDITGKFKLVEYTPVEITTGQEIEVPVVLNKDRTQGNIAPLLFDTLSLAGKNVKVTFSYFVEGGAPLAFYYSSETTNTSWTPGWNEENDKANGFWSATRTIPETAVRLGFTVKNITYGFNAVIKIELAS